MHRVLAFAALLTLAAATPLPAGAANSWTQHGTLRIGVYRDIDSIDPLLSTQSATTDLAQLIFSGLIRYDDRGDPIPDVATAVPSRANGGISADGKTITYHLRSGVHFSDGAPLTARDVVFTWHAILNPRNNVPLHYPYDLAQSVTAPNPTTVVVKLREPSAPFVALFMRDGNQGAIMPEHLLGALPDVNKAPYNSKPIGSGPFVVERWAPGNEMVLRRNDRYFGPRPKLERIDYRIIPDPNALLTALRAHAVDWYWDVPERQVQTARDVAGVKTTVTTFNAFEHVTFNCGRFPFDDLRLRRAAAYAIDWRGLAKNVYLGLDTPGMSDISPTNWAFDPRVQPYPFDLARAKALVHEAGFTIGDDGIATRNGQRLTATMVTTAGSTTRESVEVVIQQQLRAAGFDVQVKNGPANLVFASKPAGGTIDNGNFDLAIFAWSKAPEPDNTQTLGPENVPPNGQNTTFWRDAEMGRLQRQATAIYERDARKPIYAKIQEREYAFVPYHTIVWKSTISAVNTDFTGFRPARAVSDYWNAWEWSI